MLYYIAFVCYVVAATLTILLGLVYATRKQIMPYHLQALETSWNEIDQKFQFLFKMMINGAGFAGISSSIFMLVLLLIPFRDGQVWAGYSIGLVGLIGMLPVLHIVYQVKQKTKGNPPLIFVLIVNLLMLVGLLSCFFMQVD